MKCIFVVLALLSGCLSFDDQQEQDLDIKMEVKKEVAAETKLANQRKAKINQRKAIPWQNYFKPTPSPRDKVLIEKMLDSEKSTASYDELMKRGYNQLSIGLIKDAEISFRQANRKDEKRLEPVLEIARIHLRRHEVDDCLDYLAYIKDQVDSQEEPNQDFVFKYRYLLALAKVEAKEVEYGRKVLRDLISIQPDFAPGYVSLARTYLKESNERAAEFIIRRGMDRSEPNANYYTVLGVIAKKRDRNSTAERHFNKALELDENNVPALVNRSTIAIENFEFERAELDLKKALSIVPDSEDALIALAVVQRRTGRLQLAKGTLERALETNPSGSLARFHLADLYLEKLDDAEYALQLFYEVIQTQPQKSSLRTQATAKIERIKRSRL